MALATVDVKAIVKHTLPEDEGEKPTTFHLGILRTRDQMALAARVVGEDGKTVDPKKIISEGVDIFLSGVKRIENYKDPKTGELQTIEQVTEEHVDALGMEIVGQIAGKIVEINWGKGEQRKN